MLELKEITTLTDYFVICNGTSDRMLDSLADTVLDDIREQHKKKGRLEGLARDGWLIIDYGDVIVHLFAPDQRGYYNLEELWSDGKTLIRVQ